MKKKNDLNFFVLGFPNGGTTIINNIFNSIENSFSLGEPHWLLRNEKSIDKVINLSTGSAKKYFLNIKQEEDIINTILNIKGMFLKGYKETYRDFDLNYCYNLFYKHYNLVDFIILINREPAMLFAKGNASDKNKIPLMYKHFYEFSQLEKIIVIDYEEFTKGKIAYLNKKLFFKIDENLIIKNPNHYYGNHKAHNSTSIQEAKNYSVDEKYIEIYNRALKYYKKIKNND